MNTRSDEIPRSLHTIAEVAQSVRVCPKTINNWIRQGAPSIKINRVRRIDMAQFRTWLDARNAAAGSD